MWEFAASRGTSEWTAQQITEAWAVADRLNLVGPAMEQPEYSLLERKKVSRPCGLPTIIAQKCSPLSRTMHQDVVVLPICALQTLR